MIKWRIMIWATEGGHPTQAAIAKYVDDDKVTEQTWTPEPFMTASEVAAQATSRLTVQGRLW